MNLKEVLTTIDKIRDDPIRNLIFISLFLLPILLASWFGILNNISYLDEQDNLKSIFIFAIIAIYVFGLIIMKISDPLDEKLRRARLHVQNRLEHRGGNRASFEAIREEVNKKYSNEFLEKLIDKNPEIFHKLQVRRSGEYLLGIALNKNEEKNT